MNNNMIQITNDVIADMRESIEYDPYTGIMRWAHNLKNNCRSGMLVVGTTDRGYIRIRFQGKLYRAHRVAWAIYYNEQPPECIDHINRKKYDNRIKNLRAATVRQNNTNTGVRADNKSGHKGVWWHKAANKWQAGIRTPEGRLMQLFESIEDAIVWVEAKRNQHHGVFSD